MTAAGSPTKSITAFMGKMWGQRKRFLFAAMSAKKEDDFPLLGIPKMLYMDNGPIARSGVFQKVMSYLGVEVRTHLPQGKDGRRVTARAKGKVERPFRTVKEMHETLYHLHAPETEAEANAREVAMLSEVMEYYGFKKPFDRLGYFETEHHLHLLKELKMEISRGRLVALTGIVGCGKTTTLQRLSESLVQSKEVLVSRSLTVDKDRVKLGTFITALFYDLSTEKDFRPPTQPETRERKLLELMQKRRTPVALFVDDAHDLHHRTLIGLKRLIELVRLYGSGAPLSIVLAGHPKLKNDLRRPSLEEIGGRASAFGLEGIRGHQREYIEWVLQSSCGSSVEPTELMSEEALSMMATRLATPLQIEQYLTLAFEEAYSIGSKPVTQPSH
jgi:type II secretory pathway predicted ATPase ExeA